MTSPSPQDTLAAGRAETNARRTGIFRSLWQYRGFITGSVTREFQSRYRNSLLGAAWIILQPLATIVVYTLIFSQIMQAKLPGIESNAFTYSIYLCAGILTWGLFSEIAARAQGMFLEHANLIKKLSFPRLCLPVVVVLNAAINFAVIFSLFVIFLVVTGNFPGWVFLAMIPLLVLQIAFAVSLGLMLGVLHVFFRDIGQLFAVVLHFWFWLTPIVYPVAILPEPLQQTMVWNPMAGLMGGYQTILVEGRLPDWQSLWLVGLLTLLFLVLGARLYRKRAGEMVDEL